MLHDVFNMLAERDRYQRTLTFAFESATQHFLDSNGRGIVSGGSEEFLCFSAIAKDQHFLSFFRRAGLHLSHHREG
jgi:hypothetical protein